MGHSLNGVERCPHCSVANPSLFQLWSTDTKLIGTNGQGGLHWGAFKCSTCGDVTLACGAPGDGEFVILMLYPSPRSAHADIPDPARNYLQQAMNTLHAPDAAAVMAGSAVDAMLKHHGLSEGSLYRRIDEALKQNLLTQGMADWAHSVRLGSNRPRHADETNPHVSADEAKQSVEFAEALGNFLFVLTARVARGIQAATGAKSPG